MAELLAVKVSTGAPRSATAVGEFAFSDRLNRIPGVKKAVAERAGFTGEPGSRMALQDGDGARVILGLGKAAEAGSNDLRTAVAAFIRSVSKHRKVALLAPELALEPAEIVSTIAEAAILANYSFVDLRSDRDKAPRLDTLTVVADGDARALRSGVADATSVADAVCFARDLVNLPGGDLTPERFALLASERAAAAGLEVEVLDAEAIESERLGGLLAVNKGSSNPPRLVKLTYTPEGETARESPPGGPGGETVALVGKGITFDSGGLSLKSPEAMIGMKMDMGGAAAVIAAMCALPSLEVGVRVVSFTPMTDNMTGPDAQRPGDVYTARDGTTVEVLNTDAEGRLVLADALVLASEEAPAAVVDLATLTGACMVALGERIAGLMSNDDDLRDKIVAAAAEAGERVWPMPLPKDYAKQLESDVADVKNIGTRYGGSLTAGLFLQRFVGDGIAWAHLDIAGPAMGSEIDGVNPKGGTGFGVRALVQLLRGWGAEREDRDDSAAS